MHTLYRLERPIIGDRFHALNAVTRRAQARTKIKPPRVVLPDHNRTVRGEIRAIRRLPEASPNAPQLIRLNRNPFGIHRTYFQRTKTTDFSLVREARVQVGVIFREMIESGKRIPFPKPTDVHPRVKRPRRPSIDEWLSSRGEHG